MKYLEMIKLILGIVPQIISIIIALESAIPGAGNGAAKLDMLKNILKASYSAGEAAIASFEEIWPKICEVVNVSVSTFNKLGYFKKSPVKA